MSLRILLYDQCISTIHLDGSDLLSDVGFYNVPASPQRHRDKLREVWGVNRRRWVRRASMGSVGINRPPWYRLAGTQAYGLDVWYAGSLLAPSSLSRLSFLWGELSRRLL